MQNEYQPIFELAPYEAFPGFDGEGGAGAGGESGAGVTVEQVAAAAAEAANKAVNSAIANLKRTDLPKIIEQAINPLSAKLGTIDESLGKLVGGQGQGGGQGGQGGQGGGQGGSGSGATLDPQVNAELKRLGDLVKGQGSQIEGLKKDRDDAIQKAERAEKNSVIRTALGELQFATPKAFDTAFSIVESQVQKLEDGTYVGGDNLPLVDFFKDFLPKEHAYLLKPTGASGAGASNGGAPARVGRTDIADIKPGMTNDKRNQVAQEIAAVIAAR